MDWLIKSNITIFLIEYFDIVIATKLSQNINTMTFFIKKTERSDNVSKLHHLTVLQPLKHLLLT